MVKSGVSLSSSQINCIMNLFLRVRRESAYLFERDFLTYEDCEVYLDIPVSTYHRIESGSITRLPTDKTLLSILHYATKASGDTFSSIEEMKQYMLDEVEH